MANGQLLEGSDDFVLHGLPGFTAAGNGVNATSASFAASPPDTLADDPLAVSVEGPPPIASDEIRLGDPSIAGQHPAQPVPFWNFAPSGECETAVISEPWCRRPLYADVLIGALMPTGPLGNGVNQESSFLYGFRLGWDLDEVWGLETRLGFADLSLSNQAPPPNDRAANFLLWDINLVHYFGDDSQLRPFCSIGVGLVDVSLTDATNNHTEETAPGLPFGFGLKYRYDDWLVFRGEFADNVAFGSGTIFGTQHYLTLTAGLELRFGGKRTSYWPWAPTQRW